MRRYTTTAITIAGNYTHRYYLHTYLALTLIATTYTHATYTHRYYLRTSVAPTHIAITYTRAGYTHRHYLHTCRMHREIDSSTPAMNVVEVYQRWLCRYVMSRRKGHDVLPLQTTPPFSSPHPIPDIRARCLEAMRPNMERWAWQGRARRALPE